MPARDYMLDELKAWGLTTIRAHCVECATEFDIPLSAIELPGDTTLYGVAVLRPIACPACSAPARLALPLWPVLEPPAGRPVRA